jgi:uncharacterized protein YxjI
MTHLFELSQYMIRRKVFKFLGGAFHIYDTAGQVMGYSKQKAFKLKEDIRLFTDESMQTQLLVIQARQIIDFSAAYDVYDPAQNAKVGVLRRKGFKSILKDEWEILDPNDQPLGLVKEDGWLKATLRRFVEAASFFLPQAYHVEIAGAPVAIIKQRFNPFIFKLDVDLTLDANGLLDKRLALAAAILLNAIEGRQNN